MRDRRRLRGRWLAALAVSAAFGLAQGRASAATLKIEPLAAGLSYEYFGRTVVWKGDAGTSKISANLFTARAGFLVGPKAVVGLSAGLALTGFRDLAFDELPIPLEVGSSTLMGFTLGADAVVPVRHFADFEISGTGRIVYSFGLSKSWALEDFAVEGKACGESSWLEVAAGPRLAYLVFKRVVPYVEIWARWLHAGFGMTETLADLSGSESRRVRGDWTFSIALGADADLTERFAVRAKAGFMPYAGGVDALAAVGILYKF